MKSRTIFKRDKFDASAPLQIDEVRIKWEVDQYIDLSYLGKFSEEKEPGAIERRPTNWSDARYYIPSSNHFPHNPKSWAHVKGKERREVIKKFGSIAKADEHYMLEDMKRFEDFHRGEVCGMGCTATAVVSYPIFGGCRRTERFSSGGLWGIASDSEDRYAAEVEHDELLDLKNHLNHFATPWLTELDEVINELQQKSAAMTSPSKPSGKTS